MRSNSTRKSVQKIYEAVSELQKTYPDDKRKFTPDGRMVGDLGEVLAKEKYDIELLPGNTKDYDAIDNRTRRRIQIRTTQKNTVGLTKEPEILLALKLNSDGSIEEIYNGPGAFVWDRIKYKKPDKAGYRVISQTDFKDAKLKITAVSKQVALLQQK